MIRNRKEKYLFYWINWVDDTYKGDFCELTVEELIKNPEWSRPLVSLYDVPDKWQIFENEDYVHE